MSKQGYISRYLLILKRLKLKPYSSFKDLDGYLQNQFIYLETLDGKSHIAFSKRTLQRDPREIRTIFGIDIEYSKSHKGYFISNNVAENIHFKRVMEAFDIFNSLNLARDLAPFIYLQERQSQGTENLYPLLHAIKNQFQITFSYQKFWEEEPSHRIVAPYGLKEFKNRWYLMAKDRNGTHVKTYALDRLSDLEITNQTFQYPTDYDPEPDYRYCFGIINPKNVEPQHIVLSFEPFQGKYVKSLPLHHTQQVIMENEEETIIQLHVYPTHDLLMELLSFGSRVQVIEPQSLAEQIKREHEKACKQYASVFNG